MVFADSRICRAGAVSLGWPVRAGVVRTQVKVGPLTVPTVGKAVSRLDRWSPGRSRVCRQIDSLNPPPNRQGVQVVP